MSRDLKALDHLTDLMVEDLLAMSPEEIEAEIRERGDAHAAGLREGRERERADVVAWLRAMGWRIGAPTNAIERGEHVGAAAESGVNGGE